MYVLERLHFFTTIGAFNGYRNTTTQCFHGVEFLYLLLYGLVFRESNVKITQINAVTRSSGETLDQTDTFLFGRQMGDRIKT